jgi:DNA-binding transcriptional ArsR family regulator
MLAASAGQGYVCDLEVALPVKQPTVSHYFKLLRDAGLIDCERAACGPIISSTGPRWWRYARESWGRSTRWLDVSEAHPEAC